MRSPFRIPCLSLLSVASAAVLLLALGCSDSKGSPTSPGATGTVSGTVILGASTTMGVRTQAMPIGLGGVTVRVSGDSRSVTTDAAGQFTLTKVPAGNSQLEFERADIHARGPVFVAAGVENDVTVAIVGPRAEIVPGGHSGAEIEGLVSAIDSASLTVLDQRLGAVVVHTDGSTVIRNGDTLIPLSQIQIGNRVHVKALTRSEGTMLATEILLQNDKVGGNREVEGGVMSVDQGEKSFVVQAGTGTVTVTTDSSTRFRKRGSSASFSDIAKGVNVQVNGTLEGDGTVLARMVTIES